MAVPEAQPDLPNHGELKYLSNLPARKARYPCSTQAMPNGRKCSQNGQAQGDWDVP